MARQKQKSAKPRMTKNQSKIFHKKIFGGEPEVDGIFVDDSTRADIYRWYLTMVEVEDARDYYADLLVALDREDDVPRLKTVPQDWINLTGAWIARLIIRGAELPDDTIQFGIEKLEETLKHSVVQEKKPDVQFYIREKNKECMAELDELIDAGLPDDWSMYEFLIQSGFKTQNVKYILERIEPTQIEIISAYAGLDPELVEGYNKISADQLEAMAVMYTEMVEACKHFLNGTTPDGHDGASKPRRASRKPRAPKPVTPEKTLQHIRPQATSAEFGINSIPAKKILGATELWVFNTKYKILTVYRAKDATTGLGVHRTAITGYNENTSVSKRIGRHAETHLQSVLESGKIALRKFMDNINSKDAILSDRINENVVLLRAL